MNVQDETSTHTRLKSSISMKAIEPPGSDLPSDFGESACGEPLASQHLVVDFTPMEEDTEFIQKKCCAFWDFIMTCPELEKYKVLPEPHVSDMFSNSSDIEIAPMKSECPKEQEEVKTAVSMLELVEEKGLITRAFESKLQKSRCSDGSQDYFEEARDAKRDKKAEVNKKVYKAKTAERQAMSPGKLRQMCEGLQDWDVQHPKSMDPPGHPPSLSQL